MREHSSDMTRVIWTLSRIPGFGIQKFRRLREMVPPGDGFLSEKILAIVREEEDWGRDFVLQFEEAFASGEFEQEMDRCVEKGIEVVNVFDPVYPKRLAAIYDPPLILYVKGTLVPEDEAAVAIVGTRRPTLYGLRTSERFASELAMRGVTIVSGMAKGIDSEAHRGALRAKGRTIAVLGSGLDVIYPKENVSLYKEVTQHGAVVSEFPLGTAPVPFNFPKRNRLISGLSMGVVVIEANQKSGSLITAACALEEGREVYAVPGPIDSVTSIGTNQLIQKGAKLTIWPQDILEDLAPQIHACLNETGPAPQRAPAGDSAGEIVLKVLKGNPLYFDEILMQTSHHPAELHEKLTRLELEGVIRREIGGRYSLT